MSGTTEGVSVLAQGRIVWCLGKTPFEGKIKTDDRTKQPVLDKNNQPIREYGFGLAIPKSELAPGKAGHALMTAMQGEAMKIYPNGQIPPLFAWKFKDGDGKDHNGADFGSREGYAGCYVFSLTTRLQVNYFKWNGTKHEMISEGLKCGDYVEAQIHVKAHPAIGQGKPGLYLNPNAVQFLGYGNEIVNAPSAEQIFGAQAPTQLGSQTPLVAQGLPATGMPGIPNMAPQMIVQAAPAPNYGVMPQQYQPQAAQQPVATPQGFPQPTMQGVAQAAVPTGMPQIPGWPQQ